jgi:hypothetical protein
MHDLLSNTDCDRLREESTRLRAERSEFLWTLAWAGEFIGDFMRESAKARKIYGEISGLLAKSEEGRYVCDRVNDPRNRFMEIKAA